MSQQESDNESHEHKPLATKKSTVLDPKDIYATIDRAAEAKGASADGSSTIISATNFHPNSTNTVSDPAPTEFQNDKAMTGDQVVWWNAELSAQQLKAQEIRKMYPDSTQDLEDHEVLTWDHDRQAKEAKAAELAKKKAQRDKQLDKEAEKLFSVDSASEELDLSVFASDSDV